MSVRPADSAAATRVSNAVPPPAPAQTGQAQRTQQAQPSQKAVATPDTFAQKSGKGFSIPSPGDIVGGIKDGISNIFNRVKNAVSDAFNGAKDWAAKAGEALNKLVTEDIPGFASRIKDAALDVVRNQGGQAGIDFLNGVGKAREKLGIDPPPRGLKPEEITELRK